MKPTLSVVISAYNEEAKIQETLESVSFADEIIFIDNTSTDKTASIAKKFTDKIYTHENHPMLNTNKNFGFTKATGEWIFNLDADEHISEELAEEITQVITSENAINGYFVPRKNKIFGKWMEHTGWYPDYQLRLFRRGKGKFAEKHVHELLDVEGKVGHLRQDLLHYNYETVSQFLRKVFVLYAPSEAEALLKSGYTFHAVDVIRFPLKEFLSRFFAREGYKDGLHGLTLSLLQAMYHLVVFCLLWEKHKFEDSVSESLTLFTSELPQIRKETAYWIAHEKEKQTKNPLKKSFIKIKRRLS